MQHGIVLIPPRQGAKPLTSPSRHTRIPHRHSRLVLQEFKEPRGVGFRHHLSRVWIVRTTSKRCRWEQLNTPVGTAVSNALSPGLLRALALDLSCARTQLKCEPLVDSHNAHRNLDCEIPMRDQDNRVDLRRHLQPRPVDVDGGAPLTKLRWVVVACQRYTVQYSNTSRAPPTLLTSHIVSSSQPRAIRR